MAEHVSITGRGPDGRILPRGDAARAARMRATAVTRWAATHTDLDRLAVAVDLLRAAAAAAGRGGVDPSTELDRVTRAAWAAGEHLARQLTEREGRDG